MNAPREPLGGYWTRRKVLARAVARYGIAAAVRGPCDPGGSSRNYEAGVLHGSKFAARASGKSWGDLVEKMTG